MIRLFLIALLMTGVLPSAFQQAQAAQSFGIEIMLKADVGTSSDSPFDPRRFDIYQKLAGIPLSWLERTPTHSNRFMLPSEINSRSAEALVSKLRKVDGVLWASTFSTGHTLTKVSAPKALVSKFIIKLKNTSVPVFPDSNVIQQLSQTAGMRLKPIQVLASGACVYSLPKAVSWVTAMAIEERLQTLPDVQYVDIATPVRKLDVITPRDPYFPAMWFLQDNKSFPGSSNVQSAWSVTTGRPDVTVAVIDSGILFNPTHPDLVSSLTYLNRTRTQIAGWDMISETWQARDGNPRDNNPRDEGTWVTPAQTRVIPECFSTPAQTSSWHGSHVGGTIAAGTNNNIGISAVSWQARLLPVRVLGACEGALYDLTDGIYWAVAGSDVPGTEPNPYPANVINISLGGDGDCPDSLQEAIDFALMRNVTVVIAAGNETTDVFDRGMANCKGALIVAASDSNGDLTEYSNFGLDVTLSAPGGQPSYKNLLEIISTVNGSTTRPSASLMKYGYAIGTSMAAPVVSGVVSLMISAALDHGVQLTTENIREILSKTATPYPAGSKCGLQGELEGLCGAGVINAAAAVTVASSYH